jgi:hypothetical protein
MDRTAVFASIGLGVVLAVMGITFLMWDEECTGPITCESDVQCGGTISGEQFCKDGDVYAHGQSNVCVNRGTCNAVCETRYEDVLIEDCENDCFNAKCV